MKNNEYNLPEKAYVSDLQGGVAIVRGGISGYIPVSKKEYENMTAEEFINQENKKLNVTIAQALALQASSIYGIHSEEANPDNFKNETSLV